MSSSNAPPSQQEPVSARGSITSQHMLEQLLQQVTQIQRQQASQQETINNQIHSTVQHAMNHYIAQQQQSQASSAAASSSSSPSPSSLLISQPSQALSSMVKISPPSTFNGTRLTNVDSWLFEMNRYLTLCAVHNEPQRIAIASSYLKEIAFKWWENLCSPSNAPITTWEDFSDAMRERFQPLAAARTARAQLRRIHQGGMCVADYSSKFYSIVQLIDDMAEADQVDLFVASLRPGISKEVDMRDPKTLNEAMTIAQKVETLLDNRRHYSTYSSDSRPSSSSGFNYSKPYYSSSSSSASSSSAIPSSAMELGNLYTEVDKIEQTEQQEAIHPQEYDYERYLEEGDEYEPSSDLWRHNEQAEEEEQKGEQLQAMKQRDNNSRAPFLSREEFTRCMKEKLCLRCKKPGHIARNCSLPPRNRQHVHSSYPKRNFH